MLMYIVHRYSEAKVCNNKIDVIYIYKYNDTTYKGVVRRNINQRLTIYTN